MRASVRGRGALRAVVVGGLLALVTLLGAGPAAASDSDDVVNHYAMWIDLDASGVAHVRLDLEMDFGIHPNHGPVATFVVSERYDHELDRIYRISRIRASSDTAPDTVHVSDMNYLQQGTSEKQIRIGDENNGNIRGIHRYTITFDVEGWVNAASYPWPQGRLEQDELYLDVISSWDLPIERVDVTVTGPAQVEDVACYVVHGADDPCDDATSFERTARFSHGRVDRYEPFTIAVAYPAGTFEGVEPLLRERWRADKAFAMTPATGAGAALVAVGGGLLAARRIRRGRDEEFLGLTPGLAPAGEMPATVGARRRRPVAVQFAPPPGFRPGQLGTLVDEKADPHDVTATIIDLAVRQYLRIVRLPSPDGKGDGDWRLDRSTRPPEDLLPFERLLLDKLFAKAPSVTLTSLRTSFAFSMMHTQKALYADVTERGWFRKNPSHARGAWAGLSALYLVLGIVLVIVLAVFTEWALAAVPLPLIALVLLLFTGKAPARTAAGSAVLAQAEGFRLYLATAEADQLRFEEGEDLFSRYLPYAVAFGLTERWANLFAQLAAQGRVMAEPAWYVGPYYGVGFWAGLSTIGQDLGRFTSAMEVALSGPSAGTSGGSGFSGGGGGGGVGGGGGGSW